MATQAKGTFRLFLLAALIIFSLLASGCVLNNKNARRVSADKRGGSVTYFLGEPLAIDPGLAVEGEGLEVVKQIFDGLVDYDPRTMETVPAVASRWRSNEAGDEWTFWLKSGVQFHNGDPVRAEDFIYAWNRAADPELASDVAYYFAPIKGFEDVQSGKKKKMSGLSAPEPLILKVKLNQPFADFPAMLGHPVFSPVPKDEARKKGFNEKPIGNGPFMMAEDWSHEESIELERFDGYYGRSAYLDAVDFEIRNDDQTAWLEFQAGDLDIMPIPNGRENAAQKKYGPNAIVGEPLMVLNFYGFNLREEPFKGNKKLRQAINYIVNREVIADQVYGGVFAAAGGIIPPGMSGYSEPDNSYSLSKAKARKLLREAGYPGGKGLPELKLIYGTGRGHEGPAQIVQENLREFGITVRLEGLEQGAFIKALMTGQMSMFSATWGADYPSPDALLYSLFYSESGDNVLGYVNPKVDKLLMEARTTIDVDKRRELYDEAEELILSDAPIVPMTFIGTSIVHSPDIEGFERTALDDTPLDRVWLAE